MKIKCQPEDFRVDEATELQPNEQGPFALYRLTKQSLGTPEAVEALAQRWKINHRQVAYGGMKDKHALTSQHITIQRGPRRGITQTNLEVEYLGQVSQPFSPHLISANRFQLVMRDMIDKELKHAVAPIPIVQRDGLPNYFDDQRFGSVGDSREFVGQSWCMGDFERALWLALVDTNEHDRPDERREKTALRDMWGNWPQLKTKLPRYGARNILAFLAEQPTNYRAAFMMIRPDQRNLYLSAFQSHLFNALLSRLVRTDVAKEQVYDVPLAMGPMAFYRELPESLRDEWAKLLLPLPSARQKLEPGPIKDLLDAALKPMKLEQRMLRVKYPRDVFFNKGFRPALSMIKNLKHEAEDDELYPGKKKLTLNFELMRGAYATILVKRLTT